MSSEPAALLVFAKAPRPGRVKTRLARALGPEGASRLYAAFLEDVWARAGRVEGCVPELWAASEQDAEGLAPRACRVQPDGDLGARMSGALADALARRPRALLVGTDAPTLPPAFYDDARWALDTHDVVFGPSADGGFYLVGGRGGGVVEFDPAARWSTRHALEDASRGLGARSVALLRPWYDVDTPRELQLLRTHLALAPSAAPRTARALATF